MSTNIPEFQTTEIPLTKLLAWNENVRTTASPEGLDELTASIASVGLLQSLVVKKAARGKYLVVAGERRLVALSRLSEAGTIPQDYSVPCRVVPQDADLSEISLTENEKREALPPADLFEAFQKLSANGKSNADIAARFGVSETVVKKRLALARVSPNLFAKYRAGELTLELLQAFTLTDDHRVQEEVWNSLQPWDRTATAIRRLLSEGEITATDKRVRFVGLNEYQAAGGRIRQDLFSDGEQGVYVVDRDILTQLLNAKLLATQNELLQDGWKWVEVQPTLDQGFVGKHRRLFPERRALSADEERQIEILQTELEALEDCESEDEEGAPENRYEQIQQQLDAIESDRQSEFSSEVKAISGVVLYVDSDGELSCIGGLLRPEDERQFVQSKSAENVGTTPQSKREAEQKSRYSTPLLEALTMQKTAAIAAELAQQPSVALAAAVYSLLLNQFGLDLRLYRSESCVQISSSQPRLEAAAGSAAGVFLEQKRAAWLSRFPQGSAALWSWCLEQEQSILLELLAFCTAQTVNGIQPKDEEDENRMLHANAVARALQTDMRKWFAPTAENFFSKVSKSEIGSALAEVGKPLNRFTAKLKKPELAKFAESEIRGTGWVPEPLRVGV